MQRWALVQNGYVVTVVEQVNKPEIGGDWIPCDAVGPGYICGMEATSPAPSPTSHPGCLRRRNSTPKPTTERLTCPYWERGL